MNIVFRKVRSGFRRARQQLVSQRFGFDPAGIYAKSFYEDGGSAKTEASAELVAEWMVQRLEITSLLDFGSGSGFYLRAFERRGIPSLGLEASPVGVQASGSQVMALTYDLKRPLFLSRHFDAAICVEVAEHIPTRCSATLVDSICRNTQRYALFTAAPPGTPGTDHINCQPESFWSNLFSERQFALRLDLTEELRRAARNADAAEWWQSWAWCFERPPRDLS